LKQMLLPPPALPVVPLLILHLPLLLLLHPPLLPLPLLPQQILLLQPLHLPQLLPLPHHPLLLHLHLNRPPPLVPS
jgi:hypothetical protein